MIHTVFIIRGVHVSQSHFLVSDVCVVSRSDWFRLFNFFLVLVEVFS